jgi:hypothetical protein
MIWLLTWEILQDLQMYTWDLDGHGPEPLCNRLVYGIHGPTFLAGKTMVYQCEELYDQGRLFTASSNSKKAIKNMRHILED